MILQECQFSNLRMPRFGRTADHLPPSSKRDAPIWVTTQVAEVQPSMEGCYLQRSKHQGWWGFPLKNPYGTDGMAVGCTSKHVVSGTIRASPNSLPLSEKLFCERCQETADLVAEAQNFWGGRIGINLI